MKIWEKQINFNDNNNVKGFLFKIAGDLFISTYRKQKVIAIFRLNLAPNIEHQSPEDNIQFLELKIVMNWHWANFPKNKEPFF